MPVVEASLINYRSFINASVCGASRKLSSCVWFAVRFLFLDLTCFIVENVLTHVCVSIHRAHFQCETFQFGECIFPD